MSDVPTQFIITQVSYCASTFSSYSAFIKTRERLVPLSPSSPCFPLAPGGPLGPSVPFGPSGPRGPGAPIIP
jgi:hypothetical protein